MQGGLKQKIKAFADAKGITSPSDFIGGQQDGGTPGDLAYREGQMTELEAKPGYDPKMLLKILIEKL